MDVIEPLIGPTECGSKARGVTELQQHQSLNYRN